MIVYLGMPRCASTWIHSNLAKSADKETHYLYTDAANPVEYITTRTLEFSTNNWSMDSDTALAIDPYVKKYIFIFREPVDLAKSYYRFLDCPGTFTNFVQSMINSKLLCPADILERWVGLVDSKKILLYNYSDINEEWLHSFVNDLELEAVTTVSYQHKNASKDVAVDYSITEDQQAVLDQQWQKLNQLMKDYRYGN